MRLELSRLLLELLRIPSPSGEEDAIASFVEGVLRDHTRPSRLQRRPQSVIATFGDATRPSPVVLAGHLDTVPHSGHELPREEDGVIHGLGASDMKSGLAVMLALAANLGETPTLPFTLVFYDCEEVAYARNGLRPLLREEPALTRAEIAVLLEPTANTLEAGCNGTLHARILVTGTAAHSARPWMGRNAVHAGAEVIARIASQPPRTWKEGSAEFVEVINVTQARALGARNVIPDAFELNVNLRFPPDRTVEEAEAHLRSLIGDAGAVEIVDVAPAAAPRLDSPRVEELRAVGNLEVRAKQGWTDVAQFSAQGVPAVNFGPGDPGFAHKRNEQVAVDSLHRCYEVLAAFLSGKAADASGVR